jgi:radical SAM/SPASM domain protein of ACGX system
MNTFFSFQWHITNHGSRCCGVFPENMNEPAAEMSYNDMEAVFNNCLRMCEKLERMPCFYIAGGDPILHEDFWNLLELLKSRGTEFSVSGNPFQLTREICDRLKYYGCKNYRLSIDGLRATHDKIHGHGSFDNTLEKIPLINKAGIGSVITTAVSRANMKEIPEIIDTMVQNKARVFTLVRYSPSGTERAPQIAPSGYRNLLDRCWEKFTGYRNEKTVFSLRDHLWKLFFCEKGLFAIPEDLSDRIVYEGCDCGIDRMTILPDGAVYAFPETQNRIGNALATSLYDIFLVSMMNTYRKYPLFGKCLKCELPHLCRGCPSIVRGHAENFCGADPQCWKISLPDAAGGQ